MTGALYDGASPTGVDYKQHHAIKTVHQAYGRDYQLPNLTAYNETCATIGYAMWVWRMLETTGEARYADLFEQSLYNGVLPGISLEGKDFFYVNALKKLHDFQIPLRWSRTREPNIPISFCCPPNVVRTIAEASNYVYTLSKDTLWVHLYAANDLDTSWLEGGRIRLKQETDYPWDGAVRLTVVEAPERPITLKLRVPGWIHEGAASLRINGRPADTALTPGTYAEVKRSWKGGDVVELHLKFGADLWEANPLVEETLDQVAVKYGPLVYCFESNDLPAGVRVQDVVVSLDAKHRLFGTESETIANTKVVALTVPAYALRRPQWKTGQLYREVGEAKSEEFTLKLVPYYAWGNRGDTEMSVWLPTR
jgi:DUF1680 family protein